MKKYLNLFFLIAALLVTGCSCNKQLQRVAARCPELFEDKIIRDTVIVPEYAVDSFYIIEALKPYAFHYKDKRLDVAISTNPIKDNKLEVKADFKILPDTIYRNHVISVPAPCKLKHTNNFIMFFYYFGIISGIFLFIYVLIKLFTNLNK